METIDIGKLADQLGEAYLWTEVKNFKIIQIIAEEKIKLGLNDREIYFFVPDNPYDVGADTSSVRKSSKGDYSIYLHPHHTHNEREIRKIIRHELFHIAAGDCDKMYKGTWEKLGAFLKYHFIEEPNASSYEEKN